MTPFRILLLLLPLAACAAKPESQPRSGPQTDTVQAYRYWTWVYDSSLHAAHGAGRFIEEIYFPDEGIVCNVDTPGRWLGRPLAVHAYFSESRHLFKRHPLDVKVETTSREEIEVPAALAERIFDLAKGRGFSHQPTTLASKLVQTGVLRVPTDAAHVTTCV